MNKFTDEKDFLGKTIKAIHHVCINQIIFKFTDGSEVELETEHIGLGLYGIVQVFPKEKLINYD